MQQTPDKQTPTNIKLFQNSIDIQISAVKDILKRKIQKVQESNVQTSLISILKAKRTEKAIQVKL